MKRLEDMTEPELRHLCNALASGIEDCAEWLGVEKPQFCLLLFHDPKIPQYVSNSGGEGVIAAMRDTADRLERQDVPR